MCDSIQKYLAFCQKQKFFIVIIFDGLDKITLVDFSW